MKKIKANQVTVILFIVYLLALLWIIVFKLNFHFSNTSIRSINLIPFKAPLILNGKPDFGEMILNVIIFVPLGLYAGILFSHWSFGKKIIFAFLISFFCESLQFFLRIGTFDTTDLINNTLGACVGLILYLGLEKSLGDSLKTQKLINTVSAIGTILMITFLVLLKLDALWIIGLDLRYR